MSITTWILPRSDTPSPGTGGGSGYSFVAGGRALALLGVQRSSITGGLDRLIDPVTGDYVRTPNGEWAETQDSRTIMLIALRTRLGESAFDPDDGTTIAAAFEQGLVSEPEYLQAETLRVGRDLERDGILSDLRVEVRGGDGRPLQDENGGLVVHASWRDLASGSPINQTVSAR